MKLTHHADGTYSITGMYRDDVEQLGRAFASHHLIEVTLAECGTIDYRHAFTNDPGTRDFCRKAAEDAEKTATVLRDASAWNQPTSLPARKSVEVPGRFRD